MCSLAAATPAATGFVVASAPAPEIDHCASPVWDVGQTWRDRVSAGLD